MTVLAAFFPATTQPFTAFLGFYLHGRAQKEVKPQFPPAAVLDPVVGCPPPQVRPERLQLKAHLKERPTALQVGARGRSAGFHHGAAYDTGWGRYLRRILTAAARCAGARSEAAPSSLSLRGASGSDYPSLLPLHRRSRRFAKGGDIRRVSG